MEIAVCVKQAVDVVQLKMDPSTLEPLLSIAPLKISDVDRNAIEEALRIKEKHGGRVTAITLGGDKAKETLREAAAIGVDNLIHIFNDVGEIDESVISEAIAEVLKIKGPFQIILCGEMSIDKYTAQVGPRIAEKLGVTCITYARSITIEGKEVIVERDLEDRTEIVKVKMPILITVTREINTPRLPQLIGILRASKKPIETINLSQLKIDLKPKTKIISIKGVEVKRKGVIIKDVSVDEAVNELISYLIKEGVLRR
ncbi:MAG: electron transfer flavoprotein subunit beta/FixA family protein [Candidatus Methanomethylicia archaeon]|nr:electron transfer flavoprotein subunit beta/FixA family protein [Candidatus Methanomethylicia archaeon]